MLDVLLQYMENAGGRNLILESLAYMFYLPMVVSGNSTHIVMYGRQNGNWLFGDINSSKNCSSFRYTRKSFLENFRRQMIEVQIDVILQWTYSVSK